MADNREAQGNIAAAVGWREHGLVFEDDPLSEMVAELNRYNRSQILLDTDVEKGKSVPATFQDHELQGVFRYLAAEWSLEALGVGDNWVVRSRDTVKRDFQTPNSSGRDRGY